ncbi:MAG: radical SAM protein [Candidatus Cloacimonadota bacterium]|nr:radical SAM protein [Candidatus Cloacimonadota bacterium]
MKYQAFLEKDFTPFDPLLLAEETKEIVCQNLSRKYTNFYCTGVYGGISTGYLCGCCLRCIFCWVSLSRDFPFKFGKFYTPQEVVNKLILNARKKRINKLRISGGEPTICKEHLLEALNLVNKTNYFFILETNGILSGNDKNFVCELKKYNNLYVRVSLKAGTAEGFEKRTGAQGKFYELPYHALEYLKEAGIYFRAAAMSDTKLMPKKERNRMIMKLHKIGYYDYLEEEVCNPYNTSVLRLKKAGWKIF